MLPGRKLHPRSQQSMFYDGTNLIPSKQVEIWSSMMSSYRMREIKKQKKKSSCAIYLQWVRGDGGEMSDVQVSWILCYHLEKVVHTNRAGLTLTCDERDGVDFKTFKKVQDRAPNSGTHCFTVTGGKG